MKRATLPASVRRAGAVAARDLDVRPAFAKGANPFALIVETTQALATGEALHVVVDFDPRTLHTFMRSLGWAAHTVRSGDVFHVWFCKPTAPTLPKWERLQAPVQLDLRNLPTTQPVIAVLEKLVELGPGREFDIIRTLLARWVFDT